MEKEPGWYPDPDDQDSLRHWDGSTWSESLFDDIASVAVVQSRDPGLFLDEIDRPARVALPDSSDTPDVKGTRQPAAVGAGAAAAVSSATIPSEPPTSDSESADSAAWVAAESDATVPPEPADPHPSTSWDSPRRSSTARIVIVVASILALAMVGFPLDSRAGWRFAALLAILCAVTEVVQIVRDRSSDRRAGLRTTAVVLGIGPTVWIGRGLIFAAAGYTFLMLNPIVAVGLLPALFVPLDESNANRSWDRLRLIFGLVWLTLLVCFRFDLGPSGWLMGG